jgi:hypothetical protein
MMMLCGWLMKRIHGAMGALTLHGGLTSGPEAPQRSKQIYTVVVVKSMVRAAS